MGAIDSAILWFLEGNSTSTLLNSNLAGTTTLGVTTTAGVSYVFKGGEIDPKKLSTLTSTTVTSTSTSTSASPQPTNLPQEYNAAAQEIGWTGEKTEAVNTMRNAEEWFESLSDEEQQELLVKLEKKESELQDVEKINIKHI